MLHEPRYTGRFPARVSQLILVDQKRARLDNAVYHSVFQTIEGALGWIANYPVPARTPGTGHNTWTISVAPGVYEEPGGLVVPDGVTLTGHHAAGSRAAGADVVIRCDATAGAALSLGIGASIQSLRVELRGADGNLGNTLTGPLSGVVIAETAAGVGNLLQDVTITAEVNGVGNDAHPVILVDHQGTENAAPFSMVRCHLSQNVTGGLSAHADSRLFKALYFGKSGAVGILEDCWFEKPGNGAALVAAVEFVNDVAATFLRCWFPYWPAVSYVLRQSGLSSFSTFKHCRIPADAGYDRVAGQIVNDDFGTSPWEATDPGAKYEIRFEREASDLHIYAHDGTSWLRATVPMLPWTRA